MPLNGIESEIIIVNNALSMGYFQPALVTFFPKIAARNFLELF